MTIDLTRWNRSGLRRLEYVDGNAVTYFTLLRQKLAERFNADGQVRWSALEEGAAQSSDNNALVKNNERMLAFYSAENSYDISLEIARTFARSSHILTEYVNAYANENYIGTATQWDNVRRLVAMLDYHPSPPASAATTIILQAKEDRIGKVAKGELQVKHTPIDGSAPLVFENLEDIDVDPLNNELRVDGWDRSQEVFNPFEIINSNSPLWKISADSKVSVGQFALLVDFANDSRAAVVHIEDLLSTRNEVDEVNGGMFQLTSVSPADSIPWIKGYTECLAVPKDILVPQLNGEQVLRLDREAEVIAGEVVAWLDETSWVYGLVNEVDGDGVEAVRYVSASSNPAFISVNRSLYKTFMIPRGVNGDLDVPSHVQEAIYIDASGSLNVLSASVFSNIVADNGETVGLRLNPSLAHVGEVYVLANSSGASGINTVMSLGRVVEIAPAQIRFNGKPGNLTSGDWTIGVTAENSVERYQALRINKVTSFDKYFELEFDIQNSSGTLAQATSSLTLSGLLHQLQLALDNTAFSRMVIDDVAAGSLANEPVVSIQGIGNIYANQLRGVFGRTMSTQQLAELQVDQLNVNISPVLLWEFIGKAQALMSLNFIVPQSIAGLRLPQIVERVIASDELAATPIGVTPSLSAGPRMVRLYSNFSESHRVVGHNINTTPIVDFEAIRLSGESFSSYLKAGRRVILEQKNQSLDGTVSYSQQVDCTVDDFTDITLDTRARFSNIRSGISTLNASVLNMRASVLNMRTNTLNTQVGISNQKQIKLRDLPGDILQLGFTQGNLTISANVVRAGHGIRREVKVLGSGNAASLNQSFVLEVADLSFVTDPSMPKGVRADIEVIVSGQIWYQVSSLKDSRPSDPHYEVRITEEEYLRINFGDGMHGRRLPTGNNNIRVGFRSGNGLKGNLPATSLNKLAKPNRYIEDFRQPYPTDGGNDMEDISDVKVNAPTSLLTIERAVSLSDFANLAQSQASVWQARAVKKSDSRGTLGRVNVVIVPAGGLDLGTGVIEQPQLPLDFRNNLHSFLESHSQPGVNIELTAYTPIIASIEIKPYIKSAEYEHQVVAEAVKAAVVEAFSLKQRTLGQSLYLSEVFKIVEGIQGVEYSVCALKPTPLAPINIDLSYTQQVINARLEQIVYVDELRGSVIDVAPQEYEL